MGVCDSQHTINSNFCPDTLTAQKKKSYIPTTELYIQRCIYNFVFDYFILYTHLYTLREGWQYQCGCFGIYIQLSIYSIILVFTLTRFPCVPLSQHFYSILSTCVCAPVPVRVRVRVHVYVHVYVRVQDVVVCGHKVMAHCIR